MRGMNFQEVAFEDTVAVRALLMDDDVVAEQKMDGMRCLARFDIGRDEVGRWINKVEFSQRGGGPIGFAAGRQHLKRVAGALLSIDSPPMPGYVIDGELMIGTGEFRMFDMVWAPDVEYTSKEPYRSRRRTLRNYYEVELASREGLRATLSIVRQAHGFEAKRDLMMKVREGGGEGVMFKSLKAPYEPGKRVGHSVKVKNVKSADVVVTAFNRGRNDAGREIGSASFAVHNIDGSLLKLGACSLIGKPEVAVGDVIEVNYLAWTGGLIQPRMVRVRTDKKPEDCSVEQLPVYTREVF